VTISDERGREAFKAIMPTYLDEDGVETGTGFGGNPGLRLHGRIFAMLVDADLVVRLDPSLVEELVGRDGAVAFDAGKGRPMRAWLRVPFGSTPSGSTWEELVRAAFVAAKGR
jgi:hypothetical protein